MKTKLFDTENESFLIFHNRKAQSQETFLNIVQIIVSNVLFVLLMLYIINFFAWEEMSFLIYIPGILLNVMFFSIVNRKRTIMIIIFFSIIVCLFFILQPDTSNAILISLDQLIELIGTHTGNVIAPYEINLSAESYHIAVQVISAYVGLLISLVAYLIVRYNAATLSWLLIIVIFIFQAVLELENLFILNFVAICIGIYLTILSLYKKTKMIGKSKISIFSIIFLYVTFVLLVTSIIFFSFKPLENYAENNWTKNIQQKSHQMATDIRYEKEKTNTFTEGNFTNIGKLELDEEPALEIVMDKPTSVYLRGFVGSEYTSNQWLDLEPEVYYENYDLFYWLNEEAFHPLNQLSTVNRLMHDETHLNVTTMTVHNVQANSNYLYTPYELITNIHDFTNTKQSMHQTIVSDKFFGERTYQFQTYENLVSHYPTLANFLYDTEKNNEKEQYIDYEQHYNEFVYDIYTELPNEIDMMLDFYLKKEENDEGHMAYEKAINMVRDFLERRISYQLNPEPLPDNRDFLTHVLEDSKEGYATHYATAATLMFRYLNIPARYVEGYLVTPKDIKDKEEYEKVVIEGTNAHAWTEIYIDQLGWIPIETTPPYYHVMEEIDISNYPKGNDDSNETTEKPEELDDSAGSQKVKEEEDKDVINKEDKEETITWHQYIKYIAIAIILLLILIVVIYFIIKRLSIRKLKQSFYDHNINQAVTNILSYSLSLLFYDGVEERGGSFHAYEEDIQKKYGRAYVDKFKQAIMLNQIALYSKEEMSEENREQMIDYLGKTITKVMQNKNLFQRLKMRLWDFIY